MPEPTADPRRRPLPVLTPTPLARSFAPPPPRSPLTPKPTAAEPTGDPRRCPPPPPSMVLLDREVGFIDELRDFIKETGGLPLDRSIALALKRIPALKHLPACSSSSSSRSRSRRIDTGDPEQMAIRDEIKRYRAEVEEPALAMLRQRKASSPLSAAAVCKEPLPEAIDGDDSLYRELLDGIEPCFFAPPVAADASPPSVTRLSLKISWPPGRYITAYPMSACIASCHRCFLVLYVGGYRPGVSVHDQPGFYLVYNALANSVGIVPPLCVSYMSHCHIGAGVVVLCRSILEDGVGSSYVLAELILHKDNQTFLGTNKATLFIWDSSSCWWVERGVVLPLPAATATAAADHEQGTTTCSFHAHLAFAVSFTSICWVDLRTGILVYNHIPSGQFHFIPLPEECSVTGKLRNRRNRQGQRQPEEYRTMCCIDCQTLKFVTMDESYSQECPMFTSWTLRCPMSPTDWKWEKDAMSSFRIRDLWDDQVYNDNLLQPLMPSYPVISTQDPGIIYFSVTDYKHNQSHYVLSFNMDWRRVESVYKVPYAITLPPRIFTSDFSSYLNKTMAWELMHGARDDLYEGPKGKEIGDEEESRSNRPSTPCTLGVDLGNLKPSRGGLGARRVIPTPGTTLRPSSRKTGPLALLTPMGLQVALDIAIS